MENNHFISNDMNYSPEEKIQIAAELILNSKYFELSEHHSVMSDVFLVIGSSLSVTPASDLPVKALKGGSKLFIVNQMKTPLDKEVYLRFFESSGQILTALVGKIKFLKDGHLEAEH